ncbi:MAG: P27 family phage terminase small subunit [Butyrivibrio sp.]|mgnify:CR=1 FL=1|jgi:Phage terminase, small subunit.|nr:P27 family phage terminase small subunit [Butyrivibrio sp.]
MQKNISDRIRNSKKCHALRQDLLDQLSAAGLNSAVNRDLVEDYVSLWVIKQWVMIDIRTRGPVITYNNGGGQSGTKENPSIAYQLKISSQMLKILKQLGLSGENSAGGDAFDGL